MQSSQSRPRYGLGSFRSSLGTRVRTETEEKKMKMEEEEIRIGIDN